MGKITKIDRIIPTIKKRIKVAAYARVSMETERLNHSLSQQVSFYNNFIQKNPEWEFAGVYADNGISGTTTGKRAEFTKMINDAMNGKIDIILTKSISRFARNTLDLLNIVRQLRERNIEVRFEKERINTLTGDGELMLSILASFAQEESRSISENVKWGTIKRFKQGIPNGRNKVFGYKWVGNDLIVIKEEAKIIKRMYKRYMEGASRIEIGKELMADGIMSPFGKEWKDSNVKSILTNITYSGDLLFQKEYIEDPITKHRRKNYGELPQYLVENHHEAIIDKETWKKVQAEFKRRRDLGPFGNKSLNTCCFTGKIKCPYCKISYMHTGKLEKNGKRSDYWVCGSKKKRGGKCKVEGVIRTEDLKRLCSEVLNLKTFDEVKFLKKVDKIYVPKTHTLEFHLYDGQIITKSYTDNTNLHRKNVWTEERRKVWSEYNLKGGKRKLKIGFNDFIRSLKNE